MAHGDDCVLKRASLEPKPCDSCKLRTVPSDEPCVLDKLGVGPIGDPGSNLELLVETLGRDFQSSADHMAALRKLIDRAEEK